MWERNLTFYLTQICPEIAPLQYVKSSPASYYIFVIRGKEDRPLVAKVKIQKTLSLHLGDYINEPANAERQHGPERRAEWENVGLPTPYPTLPVATKKTSYDAAGS